MSMVSSVAGQPYRGYSGVERWFRDLDEQFSEWRVCYDDVREMGGAVIMIGGVTLRGRASDVVFHQPMSWIIDFGADSRVTRVRIYSESDGALDALGLQE